MLHNIAVVSDQVLTLFLLAFVGYLCGKLKLLSDETTSGLATLSLYVIAPCLMVSSFQRQFDPQLFHDFALAIVLMLGILAASILMTKFTVRDGDGKRQKVLRATVIFSNCGMISLALQNSLYGADGVFFGAACIAAFNLVFWTYGVLLLGRREDVKLTNTLLNPGMVGTVIGLIFFFTSFALPSPVKAACASIADLNTPLCMLVIGQQISNSDFKTLFSDRGALWSVLQRLVIVPLLVILVFYCAGIDSTIAAVCVIAASAPAAASNTMLAIQLKQDSLLSVKTVSMGTVLSMVTMPLMVVLARTIL